MSSQDPSSSLADLLAEFERFFDDQIPKNLQDLPYKLMDSLQNVTGEICRLDFYLNWTSMRDLLRADLAHSCFISQTSQGFRAGFKHLDSTLTPLLTNRTSSCSC
jgi:hypothetical protein